MSKNISVISAILIEVLLISFVWPRWSVNSTQQTELDGYLFLLAFIWSLIAFSGVVTYVISLFWKTKKYSTSKIFLTVLLVVTLTSAGLILGNFSK